MAGSAGNPEELNGPGAEAIPDDVRDALDEGIMIGDPSGDPRLARAARSIVCISRVFEQLCREAGVSLAQYRLMLFLRHGPRRAGELAAKVAIKRPTLTALVAGLEKEKRLRRIADEDDGRGVRIELTSAGLEALEDIELRLSMTVDKICDLGERESILGALDQLSRIVDDEVRRRLQSGDAPVRA
jgi:DNA-binding MarR family transcriptional regulator